MKRGPYKKKDKVENPIPKVKPEPSATDNELKFEDLKDIAPAETDVAKTLSDKLQSGMGQLPPEQIEEILGAAFLVGSNAALHYLRREYVTTEEAEKWAKVTRIVYGHLMNNMEVGHIVFALTTIGIYAGKKSTAPPKPKPSTQTQEAQQ